MRVWWIFLVLTSVFAIGAMASQLLLVFGAFGSFLRTMGRGSHSFLTDEDSAILIRVSELTAEEESSFLGPTENAGREPRPDGGLIVFAEGESRAGPRAIRVHCSAHFTRSTTAARETFLYLTATNNPGRIFVDRHDRLTLSPVLTPDRFRWGDESELVILLDGDEPDGIQFTARTGERVYHLAVSGRDLSDPNLLRMILIPKLERFAVYRP